MDVESKLGIKKVCVCKCHAGGNEDCGGCCHSANQKALYKAQENLKKATLKSKKDRRAILKMEKALLFYADPGTYFAIGFFPDPPCGAFMKDFSKTDLGRKPGKRARNVLSDLFSGEGGG